MSLYGDTRYLFQNYNNINVETALAFVDYVFSLVPGTGGIINGDLEITGSLLVDTDFTLAGVVRDNTLGAVISADFNNRVFYDTNSVEAILYDARILENSATFIIVDWENALYNDTNGVKSIDADTRAFYNSTLAKVMDYENSIINDITGVLSIEANSRTLNNSAGNPVFSYENGVGYTAAGLQVIDFNNSELKHGSTIMADWQHASYYDQAGVLSLDADNRKLYRSNGTTIAHDYQNGIIAINQTTYADNAAALAGGLVAGQLYVQTATFAVFMVN